MHVTAAILALAASASAHMILENPVPFGSPNNSPLDNSGSDFPCKATGPDDYKIVTMNQWDAGQTLELSFRGSAVHGGGSCQLSITTDMQPTKQTQWKVIHSIIGGCPSDAEGNLPEDPNGHGAAKFPVTLPSDLPAGQYVVAWTWFNKIGNREMYMNCAPITVNGGAGAEASAADVSSVLGNLPDMFVVNLPREQCKNTEGVDFQFPNPGQSVVTGAKAKPGSELVGAGCDAMTAMGAGAGNIGAPSQPTGGPAPPAPSATRPATPTKVPLNIGGVFAPGASSSAPSEPTAPANAPSPPKAPSPPSAPAPTGAPAPGPAPRPSPPPASGNTVPCDQDGAVVCIGANQFGLCNHGFAVPQALAAGTTCTGGVISRRSIRFPREQLHRRHQSQF